MISQSKKLLQKIVDTTARTPLAMAIMAGVVVMVSELFVMSVLLKMQIARESIDIFVLFANPVALICIASPTLYWVTLRSIKQESALKRAQDELSIAAISFHTKDGIIITDPHGTIIDVNPSFSILTGYRRDEVLGKNSRILKSGMHDDAFYAEMWGTLIRDGVWRGEVRGARKNGDVYPKWLTITAVRNNGVTTHYVGTHSDITERKEAESKIHQLAFFDTLTELPNRRMLTDRLERAIVTSGRYGQNGALIFIDLDNFKTTNDTMGHEAGDILLKQVAKRLTSCVRESDTVARLGGDEFVVVLEWLGELELSSSHAQLVGEKILAELSEPYRIFGRDVRSGGSLGVTLFDGNQDSKDLLVQADIAMYRAKRAGRNALVMFEPYMQDEVASAAKIKDDMRLAIERGQLLLYRQLQIDSNGSVVGAEALMKWNHPERGILFVHEFKDIAEETRQSVALGWWTVKAACKQLSAWSVDSFAKHLSLSLRIPSKLFNSPEFLSKIEDIISNADFNPSRFTLELDEAIFAENIQSKIEVMGSLRKLGLRLSLDDFGSGYSSIRSLRLLPIDQIKISPELVATFRGDSNSNDGAIIKMIIEMAAKMGISVLADGIDTIDQYQLLRDSGCDFYQGQLISQVEPILAELPVKV